MKKKTKKPWPTKAVMEQIYDQNLWGGAHIDFYSGDGSHNPTFVLPYVKAIQTFLDELNGPVTICDLGCGDFNIGKDLVERANKYIAIDIVPDLIDRNAQLYKKDNLQFLCLDIATDDLPKADVAILRQVLQHLSNDEVLRVVQKMAQYKYLILTEHIPSFDFIPNADIISGQGIRLKKQSGIHLLSEPFNMMVKEEKQLLTVKSDDKKSELVTTLYTFY